MHVVKHYFLNKLLQKLLYDLTQQKTEHSNRCKYQKWRSKGILIDLFSPFNPCVHFENHVEIKLF